MKFDVVQIPAQNALSELERRRNDFIVNGKYPFLIGDERNLRGLRQNEEYDEAETKSMISAACRLNAEEWLAEREKQYAGNEWFDRDEILGDWVEPPRNRDTPYVLREGFGETKESIYLGVAEIEASWMLPALVGFGGWNECPMPEAHCAVLKYWQEKYAAEIITMTGDYIEFTVKNPPRTREDALQLAWQQYWYCSDIVEQGTQTVASLGALLLDSDLWFFWWD